MMCLFYVSEYLYNILLVVPPSPSPSPSPSSSSRTAMHAKRAKKSAYSGRRSGVCAVYRETPLKDIYGKIREKSRDPRDPKIIDFEVPSSFFSGPE